MHCLWRSHQLMIFKGASLRARTERRTDEQADRREMPNHRGWDVCSPLRYHDPVFALLMLDEGHSDRPQAVGLEVLVEAADFTTGGEHWMPAYGIRSVSLWIRLPSQPAVCSCASRERARGSSSVGRGRCKGTDSYTRQGHNLVIWASLPSIRVTD